MKKFIFLISGFLLAYQGYVQLNTIQETEKHEVYYLPKSENIKSISLGYDSALSHIFWFKTLNYFGKNKYTNGDFKYLYNMCDLVTTLNTQHRNSYEFCSLMLAWEAKEPSQALKLLDRAIINHSDDWKFFYLRGFVKAFFFNDFKNAEEDFIQSSKCSDSPEFLIELASRIKNGYTPNSLKLLKYAIDETHIPREKEILIQRYEQIKQRGLQNE